MEKPWAVLDTSFWVIGHRVDVLPYLFRFFTLCVPDAVRDEVLAPDPRYPLRVYGYQEFFRLLEAQGALLMRNPRQRVPQFHAGEAAALALAQDEGWWFLVNEHRALRLARQQGIKAVTVPEFIVYLYEVQLLSLRSARTKLDGIAANTGQRSLQAAREALAALAQQRGER
jgi:predicted nucleic acid-binding protein